MKLSQLTEERLREILREELRFVGADQDEIYEEAIRHIGLFSPHRLVNALLDPESMATSMADIFEHKGDLCQFSRCVTELHKLAQGIQDFADELARRMRCGDPPVRP